MDDGTAIYENEEENGKVKYFNYCVSASGTEMFVENSHFIDLEIRKGQFTMHSEDGIYVRGVKIN